jgi:ubiquinone/menaquinone biosynthesis C-methylase UbiE
MNRLSNKPSEAKAAGFDEPTQPPRDEDEHQRWQAANRAWWESAPMRYDWRRDLDQTPGDVAYFKEIDDRFFAAARDFTAWRKIPFERLIPFDDLADKDVLEIGVGYGTHAQLLASHCHAFVGIDLTTVATTMTAKRLKLCGVAGSVLQMDAERMAFRNASFDYIWSWGVVHQSADTRRVLEEISRVLRPGGRCTVMVYYRSWWNYHVSGFIRWMFLGHWRHGYSLHQASQYGSDGAIARYYKPAEWRREVDSLFDIESIDIYGLKTDIVLLPYGRLKQFIIRLLPGSFARLLTRRLRMGSLLVATMSKPGPRRPDTI